jgi:hypothetical protein
MRRAAVARRYGRNPCQLAAPSPVTCRCTCFRRPYPSAEEQGVHDIACISSSCSRNSRIASLDGSDMALSRRMRSGRTNFATLSVPDPDGAG